MSSLLEVALSGNEEQKPFDYKLHPGVSVFVDLALGCAKEPARSLWMSMQDYAISKGELGESEESACWQELGWPLLGCPWKQQAKPEISSVT